MYFPAVIVGGPPHSGKSVLINALTGALRRRGVKHFVLRACPDGEGDWSYQSPSDLVRALRNKGNWSEGWVDVVCRSLDGRHLPLLVDMGGRPTPDQERILAHCTHAILLSPDDAGRQEWSARFQRHHLKLLADLRSDLHGASQLQSAFPVVQGVISGLDRQADVRGEVFEAVAARLAAELTVDPLELVRAHLASAPVELAVDLDRLAGTLGAPTDERGVHWRPRDLPGLLDYLPRATPLAVYGRAPNWIACALARHTAPATLYLFDPRFGWASTCHLPGEPSQLTGAAGSEAPVIFTVQEAADFTKVAASVSGGYIDYLELALVSPPPVRAGKGVVLSGKLPNWLTASLAISYPSAPWCAVYQPQLDGAIVVESSISQPDVGTVIPISPAG